VDDKFYLRRCAELGKIAGEEGNPPAGSVIVLHDNIISEAKEASTTKLDITCHAEIEAIRTAVKMLNSNDLSQCTLYTSHEPCVMCSYAIRYYKIKRVVYVHKVNYLGGITSQMNLLTSEMVPLHWADTTEVVQIDLE
jgi:tRNA(adenine34) deaminase